MNPFDFANGPSIGEVATDADQVRFDATSFAANPERALEIYKADPGAWEGAYVSGDELMRVVPCRTEHVLLKYAISGGAIAALPKRLFRERLALPRHSENERVLFTMGMPATGKTTLVKGGFDAQRFHTVVDSPLGDFSTARDLLQETEKSGRRASFILTFRPLRDAVQGMLERALPHNEGRSVTLLDMADLIGKSLSAFLQMAEMNRYDPGTTLDLVEVRNGKRIWHFGTSAVRRAFELRDELRAIQDQSMLHHIANLWMEALVCAKDMGWEVPNLLLDIAMDGLDRNYLLKAFQTANTSRREQAPGGPYAEEPALPDYALPQPDRIQSLSDLSQWTDYLPHAAQLADAHEEGLRAWRA